MKALTKTIGMLAIGFLVSTAALALTIGDFSFTSTIRFHAISTRTVSRVLSSLDVTNLQIFVAHKTNNYVESAVGALTEAVMQTSMKTGTPMVAEMTRIAESNHYVRVIVTLKGLEAGPAWAERIARARDRVMLALKGHHVEVNREYDLVPALALTVDDEALRILRSHPDVAAVEEDRTSTPQNDAGSTGNVK
jgi:hypothetical protein